MKLFLDGYPCGTTVRHIWGRRVALIVVFLTVILPEEFNSAALDKSKAPLAGSATAAAGQTVLVVQDGPGKVFLFSAATRPTPLILGILQL
jgi:hypothetical protein